MIEVDWDWLPQDIKFECVHLVDEPRQGLQRVQYGSPYWVFEMSFDTRKEQERKEIAALIARSEGLMVFNVYDPRTPLPAFFGEMRGRWNEIENLGATLPELAVKSVSRSQSALLVQGQQNQVISVGDPMEFTHNGVRHYYCAAQNLLTDGSEQVLEVYLRPRISIGSIDIPLNRVKPRQRFVIDMNSITMVTEANRFTNFNLSGIEFHGAIL